MLKTLRNARACTRFPALAQGWALLVLLLAGLASLLVRAAPAREAATWSTMRERMEVRRWRAGRTTAWS